MIITDTPSPNFGPRAEGKKIKYLILHYTGTPDVALAKRYLEGKDPAHPVSAHYLVDEDGSVTRFVDESSRAWHAGKSWWEGEEDINSCSIGIEIQNPGHDYGYRPFPSEQINVVKTLCFEIIDRHGILPAHVLAHSDIAPARKTDPGELFPWQALSQQGIGLWPKNGDGEATGDIADILTAYGYDPRPDLKTRVTAFQRHFEPHVFLTPESVGTATANTVKLAQSLLGQKQGRS
jgi:N-acetylmuramoyl-L-alanine amidase